jgi:NAD(P)H-dependent flavin oxidoreductase YrpB (nitropropane dioxygenase family)
MASAGGHIAGDTRALTFLRRALEVARGRPALLEGGIAGADDTRAALAAGAAGVVAGTRFLLTDEAGAHPECQRRILGADKTCRTTLFGLGWPAPHRVVANAATRRWCRDDGRPKLVPRVINARSRMLASLPDGAIMPTTRMQTPDLPMFSLIAPTIGMPDSAVDRTALYAGETVLRMTSVISARQAVTDLTPR